MGLFHLSAEQIANLESWKNSLNTERAQNWYEEEVKASVQTALILNKESFRNGEDITSDKFDELFSQMRWFSANRNLSNLLYRNNDIKEFNLLLRELIHGSTPFYERVNNFFKLKSMGIQTLSQFLVGADDKKYPFVTTVTKESIGISSEQDENALKDALDFFQIKDKDKLLDRTLEYLRDYIIFSSIKDAIKLERYTQVNNVLWFAFDKEEQGDEEIVRAHGSVSLEADLRDFLADNPFLIEKGLKLIRKEYPTQEVGNIDLLCEDEMGNHVVVELKKGSIPDKVVGQTLRYIGWVKKNLNKKVRGIVIVGEEDTKLEHALFAVDNIIKLKFYKVNFEIRDKF